MPAVHHGVPVSRSALPLMSATHVFLRVDSVKKPLTPPYEGPFPVLEKSEKIFKILRRDKTVTVYVDRLKPVTSVGTPLPAPASAPGVSPSSEALAPVPVPVSAAAPVAAVPAAVTLPSSSDAASPLDPAAWPPARLNL